MGPQLSTGGVCHLATMSTQLRQSGTHNFMAMVHNSRTLMLTHLELLVGNLGMMIGKFMMMVHNLRSHPQIGISFRGSGTTRYNPISIKDDNTSSD
jgi:hypothetical protein